jgi:hypothetical protein
MASLVLDELSLSSLNILIAVCDRVLGRHAAATRELREIVTVQTDVAWQQAAHKFNLLPGATRSDIADKSDRLAFAYRHPTTEFRKQFPDLFEAPPASPARPTERSWSAMR